MKISLTCAISNKKQKNEQINKQKTNSYVQTTEWWLPQGEEEGKKKKVEGVKYTVAGDGLVRGEHTGKCTGVL